MHLQYKKVLYLINEQEAENKSVMSNFFSVYMNPWFLLYLIRNTFDGMDYIVNTTVNSTQRDSVLVFYATQIIKREYLNFTSTFCIFLLSPKIIPSCGKVSFGAVTLSW